MCLGFQNHGFKTITKHTIQNLHFRSTDFKDVFGIVVKLAPNFFNIICANYGSRFKLMLSHKQLPKLLVRKEIYNATIYIWLKCLQYIKKQNHTIWVKNCAWRSEKKEKQRNTTKSQWLWQLFALPFMHEFLCYKTLLYKSKRRNLIVIWPNV